MEKIWFHRSHYLLRAHAPRPFFTWPTNYGRNPESTDKKVLDVMKKHGVNRLSFGVQSAHDEELKKIGRIHTFQQAKDAVDLARAKGFANISLDLMYGLPGQTQEMFLDSVEQCLALGPRHLSCYGLKLEPATRMGRENPALPDDDAQADTYLAMCELLRKNGFVYCGVIHLAENGEERLAYQRDRHVQAP